MIVLEAIVLCSKNQGQMMPMAIERIDVESFLALSDQYPVLDVRSPGEYLHAHIPGALSLPLFTDEERKVVGTAYKQQSKQEAIKLGLDYFGVKMRKMVEEVERICGSIESTDQPSVKRTILVHCWRGGMRSAGVAWLLDLYGYRVLTLIGGYKAYRNWAVAQFKLDFNFRVLGGYTGSGKTLLLHELEKRGKACIDLEALANHRGSALGALGEKSQPSQEMFENLLAASLIKAKSKEEIIFIEDESQRIGNLQIPMPLWYTMRKKQVFFIEIPFEKRLDYITEAYAIHPLDALTDGVYRIQKRLGGLETKQAVQHIQERNFKEGFRILLNYYDKYYKKGLNNREEAESLIHYILSDDIDPITNANILLENIKNTHGKD